MTRQRNTYLPGSRGPFIGRDGEKLQEMEEFLRQQTLGHEAGLVWGTETHCSIPGNIEVVQPAFSTLILTHMHPVPYRMRLNWARLYVHTAGSGVAKAGIYQFVDETKVRKMGGSEVSFGIGATGEKTVKTETELHLEPWTNYFLGCNAPSGQFTGYATRGSMGANSLLPFLTKKAAGLPDSVDLLETTKDYLDWDTGIVAIAYLTGRGKLLL